MASDALLADLIDIHDRTAMVGWDFSVLDGQMSADEPPWDFEAECRARCADSSAVVDLGTGGGERLISLLKEMDGRSSALTATEAWAPNIPIARQALAPWGVEVIDYDADRGDRLPFDDGSVDLVMCRHESFDLAEVSRVLAPGGSFLTQQVDGTEAHELRNWFGGEPEAPDNRLDVTLACAGAAGLEVLLADEWAGTMEFRDVRALVTYMALVPWDVPGFRVADHTDALVRLAEQGTLSVTQRRYLCHLVKPQTAR